MDAKSLSKLLLLEEVSLICSMACSIFLKELGIHHLQSLHCQNQECRRHQVLWSLIKTKQQNTVFVKNQQRKLSGFK